jgi:hypothetical protein
MEKKLIIETLEVLGEDDFVGTIDNIIEFLKNKKLIYKTYSELDIHYNNQWSYTTLELKGKRWETDEEFKKRVDKAIKATERRLERSKKRKEEQEIKDRKLLEELLKKYPLEKIVKG